MRGWLRLASHLGMSLEQCMRETSSRHFMLWMARLDEEWNENTKLDHYLAQIAAMIEAANSKEPQKVTTQGRLLKFEEPKPKKPHRMTDEERLEELETNKAIWAGWVNASLNKRKKPGDRNTMREKK